MSSQQVVTSEDAERLINTGCRFVGVLPNGKVIVQNDLVHQKTGTKMI